MAASDTFKTMGDKRRGRGLRGRLVVGLVAVATVNCSSASEPAGTNVTIDAAVIAGQPEPGSFDRARAERFTSALVGRGSIALDLASTHDALRDGRLAVEMATVRDPARLQLESLAGDDDPDGERPTGDDLELPSGVHLLIPVKLGDGAEVVLSIGLGSEAVVGDRPAEVLASAPNAGTRVLLLDDRSGRHQHDSGVFLAFEATDGSVHQSAVSLGSDLPDLTGLDLDEVANRLRAI